MLLGVLVGLVIGAIPGLSPPMAIALMIPVSFQFPPETALILLVSWSVFWIHPRELESKLTITIVCLLSLIAYNFVLDKDLPKLSYLTILDYVVLLSYIFATIPNFISIYSFEKYRKRQVIWKIVDRKSKFYGPIIYLLLVFLIIFFNVAGNKHSSAFLGFLR